MKRHKFVALYARIKNGLHAEENLNVEPSVQTCAAED